MAVFKCQMCGGDLLPSTEDPRIGICQYCDSWMPLPTVEDEKTLNRFNRANHYRMSSDFDRAKDAYEKLLEDFPDSAQAYWGLLLSRYGIEYVKDPKTGRQLPTCHRLQLHSIQDDPDYQQALKYASVSARAEYQRQAAEISRIQKESLALSAKEPPYDIFICYKEQDDHTRQRTRDSVIAQDIYTALVKEGYKVFFSRITLESRLGKQYEPIIYAALRSAKVMLVVTTSREHCSAVWVKNEWSRFLDMMAEDPGKKALIPDHKFSEIRWDEDTGEENTMEMSDEEIVRKFQLLDNQRNLQKREICRRFFQQGIRGTIYGIKFFYEGGEIWDDAFPAKGRDAEPGCVGCPWYDIDMWRKKLNERLGED